MTRPSVSKTCIILSSKSIDFARAVAGTKPRWRRVLSLAEVVIPRLQESRFVLFDKPADVAQLARIEAMVCRQVTGLSHNFAYSISAFTWMWGGSRTSLAEKEETKTSDSENCWHRCFHVGLDVS